MKNERYMGSVKVGPKGQIVIPKEVREMFGIEPGDTLVLLADAAKGIAIERMSVFDKIADAILEGRAKGPFPKQSEDPRLFAEKIKKLQETEGDK